MKNDPANDRVFRASDFGVVGDDKTSDTAAIQRAIDACAQGGGGVVVLHNGTFLTETLFLRSHVELHLTSTAVLLGSTNWAAYHADPKALFAIVNLSLIHADGCEDIAITGQGTIDGQGHLFCEKMKQSLGEEWWRPAEATQRPVLIRLRDCRNVQLEGVLLRDSAAFCVCPTDCRQVRIEGLRIECEGVPNNDGLHIIGGQEVFVSNCRIRSGDDCIAIYTYEGENVCRDIVVTNCILSSRCAAIRIGLGALRDIERIAVSNCVIRDTRWNGIKIQQSQGSIIRDMTFSNIRTKPISCPTGRTGSPHSPIHRSSTICPGWCRVIPSFSNGSIRGSGN